MAITAWKQVSQFGLNAVQGWIKNALKLKSWIRILIKKFWIKIESYLMHVIAIVATLKTFHFPYEQLILYKKWFKMTLIKNSI